MVQVEKDTFEHFTSFMNRLKEYVNGVMKTNGIDYFIKDEMIAQSKGEKNIKYFIHNKWYKKFLFEGEEY